MTSDYLFIPISKTITTAGTVARGHGMPCPYTPRVYVREWCRALMRICRVNQIGIT
ncbi:hypothetical protein [Phormidesmis priestleyi]|uniref:hypothetical protein n=1 Tax=Phormidesmis priestleyi TaxID=268141 RepID=UPI0015E7BE82|nr:hypothetical protein [Phormidesmis priestleyi]